jgi:hypothetical protein
MKKLIFIIVIVYLAIGCVSDPITDDDSNIVLEVKAPEDVQEFSLNKFSKSIELITGNEVKLIEDGPFIISDSEVMEIKHNPENNFTIYRDYRGYDIPFTKELNDDTLINTSRSILKVMGASDSEMDVQARYLTEWAREVDPARGEVIEASYYPIVHNRLARKVFINRRLNGVDVLGDQVVVTFALDGTLRKIYGMWRTVDWNNSKLDTTMTKLQVQERAFRVGEERNSINVKDIKTCLIYTDEGTLELMGCYTQGKSVEIFQLDR